MSKLVQLGGVHRIPRTEPMPVQAMEWIVRDMQRVSDEHRIPVRRLLETAQFYWGPATERGGTPNHGDPLFLREWPNVPLVHAYASCGWKAAVLIDDDDELTGLGVITEGITLEPR